MRTARQDVFALAAILVVALVAITGNVDAFRLEQNPALSTQQQLRSIDVDFMNRVRGGSAAIDVDIESSDYEETDDEDEEEAPSLVKATKKAATKTVKKSVAAAIKSPQKKSSSLSLGKFFRLPYIVKACLNPVVFFRMTAGYWKSLYNINYMTENVADSSQDLRTALEQKARYGGGAKKGRRKMKPGQAKTLSDLPALST